MLRSAYFRLLVMGVVLANGIITATMNFKHDGNPREFFYEKYYYIEVGFVEKYFFLECKLINSLLLMTLIGCRTIIAECMLQL